MTPTPTPSPTPTPTYGRPRTKAGRLLKNYGFALLCGGVALLSVLVLGTLLFTIARQGLEHLGWEFITTPPSRRPSDAGLGPAIWGSIWICAVCAVFAIPIGVGTAIFLEEFRPKQPLLRKLHGFVQLNISNLAGVPSIVYGLLGLTVFVQAFGWFNNPNEPTYQIGVRFYDQFIDETGQYLMIPIDDRAEPLTEPRTGMIAYNDAGEPIELTVYSSPADIPEESGAVLADVEPFRIDEKRWYYLQLPFGRSVLAGGLTLMLVVLPIVIVSSQEAIRAVPNSLREASMGLGATRWQMIRRTTLPAAIPGIMTGSILAMSRAIGEAAPILIIAGIVFIRFTPEHLMDDFTAMPLQIFDWAGRPQEDFHRVAASGIIVLLAILLSFNAIAVFIRQKFQKRLQ